MSEANTLSGGASETRAPSRAPWWLALGVLGLLFRLVLSTLSHGTNDVDTWRRFARLIDLDGLTALYHRDPLFNHPPLAGLLAEALLSLSEIVGVPFPFLLRLPGIVAEWVTAYLVWWAVAHSKGRADADRAVAVFGLSLISILISGYHGNTDPLYVTLMLASLLLLERGRAPLLAGFALGAALNVKLLPALLFPVLLARCRSSSEAIRVTAGVAPWLVPFLVMAGAAGGDFLQNVFAYGSQGDYWGITGLLLMAHGNTGELDSVYQWLIDWYRVAGKCLVILGVFILCDRFRAARAPRACAVELAALVYATFALLAPGFAIQYLVIFPPFLAITAPGWSIRISLLAGLTALSSYLSFLVSWDPIRSVHNASANKLSAFLAGMLWIAIFAYLCEVLARWHRNFRPKRENPTH